MARRTSRQSGSFSEDVVRAVGNLAQLFDRFRKVAFLGGIPHRGAVEVAVEQLIPGANTSAYRTQFLFGQS